MTEKPVQDLKPIKDFLAPPADINETELTDTATEDDVPTEETPVTAEKIISAINDLIETLKISDLPGHEACILSLGKAAGYLL